MAVYNYRLANGQTRWFFIIDLPPDANGRRHQHKRQGFPNQAAALKAEEDARAAYGRADLGADGSVAAELESWLNEREPDVQETTLGNYRDIMRCYVVPHIGARQLYALDKRVIHELYKKLLKGGGKNGGPLSSTTVRIVHRVMMKALSDLGVNVDGVRQPRQAERETMGRKGVWTPAQSAKFLKYHADHRLRAAWVLAIVVGTRRGELAGLKWPRVDLDRGVLLLHWQRTTTSNGVVEKSPKGRGKRAVALGPALAARHAGRTARSPGRTDAGRRRERRWRARAGIDPSVNERDTSPTCRPSPAAVRDGAVAEGVEAVLRLVFPPGASAVIRHSRALIGHRRGPAAGGRRGHAGDLGRPTECAPATACGRDDQWRP